MSDVSAYRATTHTAAGSGVSDSPKPAAKQDFAASLSDAVRANPASAALIGMGVAWLFFGGSKTSLLGSKSEPDRSWRHEREWRGRDRDDDGRRYEPRLYQAPQPDYYGAASHQAGSVVSGAAASVGAGAQQLGSGIASGAATVADVASQGYEIASSFAGDAASYIGSTAYEASRAGSRMARTQAGHVQQTLGEFFEGQPLALGVLGIALGAGIAALLPKTDLENEYLGETSDALKEQARSLAGDKLGEVKDLAANAMDEVVREAEAQGLTKAALTDKAAQLKESVANVAATAKQSIGNETSRTPGV